ncbi:MAG: DMT family transporter [Alphaproteobacteria bacterium]|nr:DMT family transporter [Alphaproteobacteria bacterium]
MKKPFDYLQGHTPEIQAIVWSVSSSFWFALMAVFIQHSSNLMNPMVMVFGRNVCSLLFLMPFIHGNFKKLIFTKRLHFHFARSSIGAVGMMLWFYSLTIMPVNNAIALSFTAPLFTTILAVIFLSEKVGYHRMIALVIGFLGALIILRPGTSAFHVQSLIVLVTTCFWALASVFMKMLSRTEKPITIVFYFTLIMIPVSFPFAYMHWETLTLTDMLVLLAIGVSSSLGQLSLTTAISKTDTSFVVQFDFFRLIFASIFAYIAFHQTLDQPVLIGAVIITVSTIYIARREAKLSHRKKAKIESIKTEILQ